MSNAIPTPTHYAKAGLTFLKNHLVAGKKCSMQYTPEFKKVGDTVYAKRHPEFTVGRGRVATRQDVLVGQVPVKLNRQRHILVGWNTMEETLTVDALLKSQSLDAAMGQLAQQVDSESLGIWYRGTYNHAGTPGSAIDSTRDFFYGPQRLSNMAVPENDLHGLLNTDDSFNLAGAFTGGSSTSIPEGIARSAIENATIPMIGGIKPVRTQSIPSHTPGSWAASGDREVKGAGQSVSYSTASVRNTWSQGLLVDGFSNGATLKVGDVFTIEGVYAVNPRTKQTLAHQQQFTVLPGTDGSGGYAADSIDGETEETSGTYTFSTGGSSEMTLQISPPIITSGAFQTVSAAPADNANIVLVGTASTAHYVNLCYHRNAYALCMAKPTAPRSGEWDIAEDPETGIAIRYWRFSDGVNDEHYDRFDVIFGATCLDGRLATRLSGT